jgi:tagatose 6-phosphate kinase
VILTVTPNAAVDKTYRIEGFRLDCVNRPSEGFTVAGGKGVNAARVYQTMGGKAIATGFLAGANGETVAAAMRQEQIQADFVYTGGESRICIAIIDPLTGSQTEVNESGPHTTAEDAETLIGKVHDLLLANRFEFVVLCGSLPPGCPANLYARLIALCNSLGVKSVLDASGEPLRLGAEVLPWMLKPNQAELESLLGKPVPDLPSCLAAVQLLRSKGIPVVVATRGSRGAVAACGTEMWHAAPGPIHFASAVASGDSLAAAFLYTWEQCATDPGVSVSNQMEQALKMGIGAGAANAEVIGAGFCSRDSIVRCASAVRVTKLESNKPMPAEGPQPAQAYSG